MIGGRQNGNVICALLFSDDFYYVSDIILTFLILNLVFFCNICWYIHNLNSDIGVVCTYYDVCNCKYWFAFN